MAWRLAKSLVQLQKELDARFPNRTRPDWTIGDAAHQRSASDHNPNAAGVVTAIDVRGRDMGRILWDHLSRRKDPRLKYMIFDGRIMSSTVSPWTARTYTGSNPHNDHIHISVGRGPDGQSTRADLYDDTSPWGIATIGQSSTPAPAPSTDWLTEVIMSLPTLKRGAKGAAVKRCQALLAAAGYPPANSFTSRGEPDGIAGPGWEAALKQFQAAKKVKNSVRPDGTGDGVCGRYTWERLIRG